MKPTTLSICTRRHFLAALGAAAAASSLSAATPAKVRLAVTTDEIDEDLATAIAMLNEFGLHYVEIRNLWGKYNTAQPLEKVHEAKALLDRSKLRTCVLDTGFFKVPLPPETPDGKAKLDDQWQLLDKAFERAAILGVDCLRIFAFMFDPAKNRGTDAEYERIAELLGEAARRARAKQMRLAIENVSGSYVATGADAARLLKLVKDAAIGLTWDPNNAGMSGEKAFPDGYQLLDPARILHVHLRDYRRESNGKVEWCAVGQGEFDNLGQIRALLRDRYSGYFTLETHYRSPQGKAHATRTSLTALLKIIEQV
ncbi:MAG: sugar phosphate isomerase/epimerase [Verrucomicrobia bacterium]|nr:sugar phosphate isomerase/epimerase [Verrucomicrobiota bacterium]